jgi:hypothetical protein
MGFQLRESALEKLCMALDLGIDISQKHSHFSRCKGDVQTMARVREDYSELRERWDSTTHSYRYPAQP